MELKRNNINDLILVLTITLIQIIIYLNTKNQFINVYKFSWLFILILLSTIMTVQINRFFWNDPINFPMYIMYVFAFYSLLTFIFYQSILILVGNILFSGIIFVKILISSIVLSIVGKEFLIICLNILKFPRNVYFNKINLTNKKYSNLTLALPIFMILLWFFFGYIIQIYFPELPMKLNNPSIIHIVLSFFLIILCLRILINIKNEKIDVKSWIVYYYLISIIILYRFSWLALGYRHRYPNANWIYAHTNYLVVNGQLTDNLYYHNWPGLFFFSIPFAELINNPWITMLVIEIIFTVIGIFCVDVFYYLILSKTSIEQKSGTLIFMISQTLNLWYYTSSFYGFLLYLVIVNIALSEYTKFKNDFPKIDNNRVMIKVTFLVLLIYNLSISHIGSTMFLLSNFAFIMIFLVIKIWINIKNNSLDLSGIKKSRIFIYTMLVIFLQIFLLFSILRSITLEVILDQIKLIMSLSVLRRRIIPYKTGIRIWVTYAQGFIYLFLGLLTALILRIKYKKRKLGKNLFKIELLIIVIISEYILIIMTDYGYAFVEIKQRVYVFSLLPIIAILISEHWKFKYILVLLFVIMLISPIVYYGRDYNSIPESDIQITEQFMNSKNHSNILAITTNMAPVRAYTGDLNFYNIPPDREVSSLNETISTLFSNFSLEELLIYFFWYENTIINFEIFESLELGYTYNDVRFIFHFYNLLKGYEGFEQLIEFSNETATFLNLTDLIFEIVKDTIKDE